MVTPPPIHVDGEVQRLADACATIKSIVEAGKASSLTGRELEVLARVLAGAKPAQIATSLGLSRRTVKTALSAIYAKAGVDGREQLVRTAFGLPLADTFATDVEVVQERDLLGRVGLRVVS